MDDRTSKEELDKEWVILMIQAKQFGLEPDEVRDFLLRKKPGNSFER